VDSLREIITNLVSGLRSEVARFPGGRGTRQTPNIEELARSVMDYGQMRLNARSRHGIFVEVEDLAFRLRETRRAVREALTLLEGQGRAERTKQNGLWRLRI
jgi:hypothetical protein